MTTSRIRLAAALAAAALLVGACAGPEVTGPPALHGTQDAQLRITALVVGTPIDLMVARVSASDIAVPLVFNLPVAQGVATGTLRIPPGSARTIALEAFNEQGDITHEGSATLDVRAGANPPINIAMLPRGGDVPITATLAEFSVIVSPADATVPAGETLQFTAQILDADDNPMTGTVVWAVTNPAFARISAAGLATGVAPGALTVVATFGGVAGTAQLIVGDGTTGNVTGNVTSSLLGALAGVTVSIGGRTDVTDASGAYAIDLVPSGERSIALTGLPAGCTAPSASVTVLPNQTVSAPVSVNCVETGSMIFNEIMPDPIVALNSTGEWIELYNGTGQTIDLNGWVIRNDIGSQCTLSGQVSAGGYYLVARNADPAQNGGVFGAITCNVPLDNTFFTLTLLAPGGSVVDAVAFGNAFEGNAWNLDPDSQSAGDNDNLFNWCLSLVTYNSVDSGTPGSANHQCN